MVTLVNRAKMSTSTTGTGTITLGSAESGYQSFADAGVSDGDVVRYAIEDGSDWEIGSGTYTASGTTLTRTVDESSNSDAALSLTGSAVVFITAAAEDVFQGELFAESYDGTSTKPNAGGTNTIAIGVNAYAVNENSIAFGTNASAQGGTSAVALGDGADARQVTAVAIGYNTYADGSASVALGRDAQARADNAIALGKSRAGAASSIAGAINNNSSSYGTTGVNSVSLGTQSRATNNSAASIGQSSIASGYQSAAYGYNAVASGQDSFAGGSTTDATATNSTALGKNAQATHANATAVGYNAATSATNQVALGASGYAVKISDTYTLPTSDGTNGQVLTTDGSGAVTFADAGGGAALELYAENPSSPTAPSATGSNAVAIGDGATSSQTRSIAIGYNSTSSGVASTALGPSANASGFYGTALGYNAKAVSGGFTSVLALGNSYASGADSLAAAIANNTSTYGATGQESVAIGKRAKATGLGSLAISANRFGPATSTSNGAVAIGDSVTASGSLSLAMGYNTTASASSAIAIGSGITNSTANQVVLGGTTQQVKISDTYTLPTADGSANQVLTTDGSGAVTFADAGGGGSTITVDSKTAGYTIVSGDAGKLISFSGGSLTASLTAAATLGNGFYVYIENNAANGQNTHVVTIDPNASETIDGRSSILLRQGQRILIVCDGSEWKTVSDFNRAIATNARATFFNLPQATGAESVAIGLASVASNTNTTAIGLAAEATGSYSTSFGTSSEATAFGSIAAGYNSVSSGSQSIALGVSYASGADSFAAAIANNTSSYGATGANSVAIGYQAKATGQNSMALGGTSNNASGLFSSAIGPSSNISSGTFSVALGDACEATTNNAFALGHDGKSVIQGKFAYGSGKFSTVSDAQNGMFVLRRATTDATATQLTTNNGSAGTTNQVILPNNSAYAFHGTIVARQQASAGTASAAWKVEGLIRREGSAGTTVLVNSATTVLDNTPGWGMALSADTTNGGLKVEATGAASTNIRWVATIHTSEVTYA